MCLYRINRDLAPVENAGCQSGFHIGVSKDLGKVLYGSGPTGGNYRNTNGLTDCLD
jgi:hypothetical protein